MFFQKKIDSTGNLLSYLKKVLMGNFQPSLKEQV